MTIYLIYKKRGAPIEEYAIHSRVKNGWRHIRQKAEALRKELGSGYVVQHLAPYGWLEVKEGKYFLPPDMSTALKFTGAKDLKTRLD